MKNIIFTALVACLTVVLFTGCEAPGGGSQLPGYYVEFNSGGQHYLFDKGLTDVEPEPFAGYQTGNYTTTVIATPDTGTENEWLNLELSEDIYITFDDGFDHLFPDTPGTTGELTDCRVEYWNKAAGIMYFNNQVTLTVTENSGVGGTVAGNFNATLINPDPPNDTISLTGVSFRAKRILEEY